MSLVGTVAGFTTLVLLGRISSELTRGPDDVLAVIGSTVTLTCSTNLPVPVLWDFRRANAKSNEPWSLVYFGYPTSQIVAHYRNKNKYNVTVDSTHNEYNLMIYNLQTDDAGTYRCIDEYGFGGHKHDEGLPNFEFRAEVAAIESRLNCSQNIKGYQLNQENLRLKIVDMMKMRCNIAYTGKISPNIRWSVIETESEQELLPCQLKSTTTLTRYDTYSVMTSDIEIRASKEITRYRIKCSVTADNNGAKMSVSNAQMPQFVSGIIENNATGTVGLYIGLDQDTDKGRAFNIFTPTELSTIKESVISAKQSGLPTPTITILVIIVTVWLLISIVVKMTFVISRHVHVTNNGREEANLISVNVENIFYVRNPEKQSIIGNTMIYR